MESSEYQDLDFSDLSNKEKEVVLEWAKKVRATQKNSSLSVKEKIKAIKELNNKEAFNSCSKIAMMYSKRYWKNASWAERLSILAGGGTIMAVGFAGSGVAALGTAVGIPFFLVTAAGGAFIGMIIDKLESK